tara:strand:- start:975 stop:1595 length:621 start_codon:yes stop_codon:yes gene_type:complete
MASIYIPQIIAIVRKDIDWTRMVSSKGNTQVRERYYISLVEAAITQLGGIFNSAPSQGAVDIRDIKFPDHDPFAIEGKASGGQFKLNDTLIKSDVYYLFVYSKHREISIELGQSILSRSTDIGPHNLVEGRKPKTKDEILRGFQYLMDEVTYSVRCGVMSLFDFGEMWKKTYYFGKLHSRPRPNWGITVPPRPTEPVVEAQHSPPE